VKTLRPTLLFLPVVAASALLGSLTFLPAVLAQSRWAPAHVPGRLSLAIPAACAGENCAELELIEMEVRDVVPLEEASTHAVVLITKDRATVLPIFVDETAAVAIAFRLAHRAPPHPLAQDLMDSMLTSLGGELTEVRIDGVENAIFRGRVFISQNGKKLTLDARPSDSIALALTQGAKIFASRNVLNQAGISKSEIDDLRSHGGQGPGVGGSGPSEDNAEDEGEISL
jgi:uncharacterized protein